MGGSLGALVAEDAAARRRLVQLPAHGRPRRPQGRGPDARRVRGPQAHRRAGRLRARATCRASSDCFVVDVAPQTRHPPDAPARRRVRDHQGRRDGPRALRRHGGARPRLLLRPIARMLPQAASSSLLVAGRHYSATAAAQKMSREIPPCMAMGEAAGVAAALALDAGVSVRHVDVARSAGAGCAPRAPIPATSRPPTPTCRRSPHARRPHDRRPSGNLPLAGIRVIDFTQVMMGPVVHADARRLRRRRDQDRAAGRRRPVARPRSPTIRTASTTRSSAASTATSAASRSTCATREQMARRDRR